MTYINQEDKEIDLSVAEIEVIEKIEYETVSDSELLEIEDHLKRLYLNNIKELYHKLNFSLELEKIVKRPLYVAAINFCDGDVDDAVKVLGITVSKLKYRLVSYFGTTSITRVELSDLDKRLNLLYKNYLEQILVDDLSVKFTRVVDKAVLRAAMEFAKEDFSVASRILGIKRHLLVERLEEFLGDNKEVA